MSLGPLLPSGLACTLIKKSVKILGLIYVGLTCYEMIFCINISNKDCSIHLIINHVLYTEFPRIKGGLFSWTQKHAGKKKYSVNNAHFPYHYF